MNEKKINWIEDMAENLLEALKTVNVWLLRASFLADKMITRSSMIWNKIAKKNEGSGSIGSPWSYEHILTYQHVIILQDWLLNIDLRNTISRNLHLLAYFVYI